MSNLPAVNGLWTLVLAGGDGTRLQDLTRRIVGKPIPKQYCRLLDERSLLETTLARIAPLAAPSHTLVVANENHLALARPQLGALPPGNLVIQPSNRDTGPGLLLSLLTLAARSPRAYVAVFPSDHYVADAHGFLAAVAHAVRVVHVLPDRVAMLGIPPEHPDPGLGYIEPSAPLPPPWEGEVFQVASFHEKPDPGAAAHLVARGGLWNSFVMAFRVDRMLDLLWRIRSADVARMCGAFGRPTALGALYKSLEPWNFSRDFLARIPSQLVVVRADRTGWSDWGTPESIERTLCTLNRTPPWRVALPAAAIA